MRLGRRPAGWLCVVGSVLVTIAASACGTSTSARGPLPAGPNPSPIATMPCRPKSQNELTKVLGVTARVPRETWLAHRYSCPYVYPNGSFTLSVQELSSWSETLAYFHALGQRMGYMRSLANLGQGAFQVNDGSVVVRKDWKVLLVDVSKLPPQFGVPATSSAAVAVTVADVILGCWNGD